MNVYLITSMAQQGAAQLYRKCGYEEEKRLVTEDPAMQNMNIVEKFIYSRVLNLYEFVFYRKYK